ncbi:MAG: coenzyme F420-0:L-glutamate ligase [Betaproteobacteria bacterium]|nr:coenzyme F420-0:L-glutamate ligase [Betaproteobacteria bacterium]
MQQSAPGATKRATQRDLLLKALPGIPMVEPGDDVAAMVTQSLASCGESLVSGDVVVIAQKVVSKAENRYVSLAAVRPGERARELARICGKDPRFVELVLRESVEVVRCAKKVLITRNRRGHVYANAGIDQSNIESKAADPRVLLLPVDSDASAERLRAAWRERWSADVAVIINDSAGRPWRMGVTGIAIGCAGLLSLVSRIGDADLFGKPLQITEIAVADELAAAASFLMGQADEARPAVLIRGATWIAADSGTAPLIRRREHDLFA